MLIIDTRTLNIFATFIRCYCIYCSLLEQKTHVNTLPPFQRTLLSLSISTLLKYYLHFPHRLRTIVLIWSGLTKRSAAAAAARARSRARACSVCVRKIMMHLWVVCQAGFCATFLKFMNHEVDGRSGRWERRNGKQKQVEMGKNFKIEKSWRETKKRMQIMRKTTAHNGEKMRNNCITCNIYTSWSAHIYDRHLCRV